jgi:hypothetical protein
MTISNKPLALLAALGFAAMLLPAVPAAAQTGGATMSPRPDVGPSDTTTVTGTSGSSGPSATTTVRPAPGDREMPHPGIPGGNDRLQRLKDNPPNTGIDPTPGVREQR